MDSDSFSEVLKLSLDIFLCTLERNQDYKLLILFSNYQSNVLLSSLQLVSGGVQCLILLEKLHIQIKTFFLQVELHCLGSISRSSHPPEVADRPNRKRDTCEVSIGQQGKKIKGLKNYQPNSLRTLIPRTDGPRCGPLYHRLRSRLGEDFRISQSLLHCSALPSQKASPLPPPHPSSLIVAGWSGWGNPLDLLGSNGRDPSLVQGQAGEGPEELFPYEA